MSLSHSSSSSSTIFITIIILAACSVFQAIPNRATTTNKTTLDEEKCDLYNGSWVYDESYPLYDSTGCPFVRREFDCQKYGRSDQFYLSYRWQPTNCNLPRFDGKEFLERFKGKKIMFVGDSLSLNIFDSLVCLLHAAVPNATIVQNTRSDFTIYTFQDYEVIVALHHSLFLVDVDNEPEGRVLKLNSIKSGEVWKKMDVLVFNTWQWWGRRGDKQPWDYVQDGLAVAKDMDRMDAFHTALMTWANWVNTQLDTEKTQVFFQGVSPSHYKGEEWHEEGVTNCSKEIRPINGTTYPGGLPTAAFVIEDVLSSIIKPVTLLDITNLSQLRKDGHPAMHNGLDHMDCTHWCIAGVPDTWNELLLAQLMM
ncbi:unnamed protein product [Rhodiola kirilowii]